MNKGTALVGFLLSFLAGMGLMWGIAQTAHVQMGVEVAGNIGAAQVNSPIPVSDEDPSWGKPDAPVTIVEISDFECPFCARVTPTVERVKNEYGAGKIRLVWKDNPMSGHLNARPAAEAGAVVHALGGDFWKFNHLAFANQKALTPENFGKWATVSGVDARKFEAAYASKKFGARVDRDIAWASEIGERGTPHFRINGKPLRGAQPFEKFKELIDEQLAAADALAKAGIPANKISVELTKKNYKPAEQVKAPATKPPPPDTTVWKVPVLDDDPYLGASDALVTIIEFSDFQCPFCSRVEPTLQQLMNEYENDVRVVWKDNPMSFHARATPAAYVARFAYEKAGNKGFWAAHHALFASQSNLDDPGLEEVANKLGLSWEKISAAIKGRKYQDKLDDSSHLAEDFQVRSTPYFFINGRRLSGAQPYETFKELVDQQLAEAKALASKGVSRDKVFRELMKAAKDAPELEKKDLPAPGKDSPFKGPQNAKVVIQEFSDFQCPYCSRVGPTLTQIMEEHPKDVKFVWLHMPASFHPDAALAAEAAQEAFAQAGNNAFWKYHDKLFANQGALKRPGSWPNVSTPPARSSRSSRASSASLNPRCRSNSRCCVRAASRRCARRARAASTPSTRDHWLRSTVGSSSSGASGARPSTRSRPRSRVESARTGRR
jgi:protein-disulfide isomerase